VRYPPIVGRLVGYVGAGATLLRRRKESRRPRVRVRMAHGETRVLPEGTPEHAQILSISRELIAEHERAGRGRR
jgi:hypothetical protein